MSRTGECSIWKKRGETVLYMEINKSENKNQGIQELLN